eukprot:TRINITY_DN11308_c0_g1_i1.p1 TRINITY_DN11308_c0_g1~~TRINITY_DN11308_c0_g1_i1.p1  ORF type:complete len:908 (+),score=227.30 TRINITY_DN11308_c0_g1_i1:123-2846(+)
MAHGTGTVLIGGTVANVHVRPDRLSFHAEGDVAQAFELPYGALLGLDVTEVPILKAELINSDIEMEWQPRPGQATHTKMKMIVDHLRRQNSAGDAAPWPPELSQPLMEGEQESGTTVISVRTSGKVVILKLCSSYVLFENVTIRDAPAVALPYQHIIAAEGDGDVIRIAVRGHPDALPHVVVLQYIEHSRNTEPGVPEFMQKLAAASGGHAVGGSPLSLGSAVLGGQKGVAIEARAAALCFKEHAGEQAEFEVPYEDMVEVTAHDGLRVVLKVSEHERVVMDWVFREENTIDGVKLCHLVADKIQAARAQKPRGSLQRLHSDAAAFVEPSAAERSAVEPSKPPSRPPPHAHPTPPSGNATATATLLGTDGVEHIVQTYPTCLFIQQVGADGKVFGVPYTAIGSARPRAKWAGAGVEILLDGDWLSLGYVDHVRNTHDPHGLCCEIENRKNAPPPSQVVDGLTSLFVPQSDAERSFRNISRPAGASQPFERHASYRSCASTAAHLTTASASGPRVRGAAAPLMKLDFGTASSETYRVQEAVEMAFWDNYANQAPPAALASARGKNGKLFVGDAQARGTMKQYLKKYPIQIVASLMSGARAPASTRPTTFMCGPGFLNFVNLHLDRVSVDGEPRGRTDGDRVVVSVLPPGVPQTLALSGTEWRAVVSSWNATHGLARRLHVSSLDASFNDRWGLPLQGSGTPHAPAVAATLRKVPTATTAVAAESHDHVGPFSPHPTFDASRSVWDYSGIPAAKAHGRSPPQAELDGSSNLALPCRTVQSVLLPPGPQDLASTVTASVELAPLTTPFDSAAMAPQPTPSEKPWVSRVPRAPVTTLPAPPPASTHGASVPVASRVSSAMLIPHSHALPSKAHAVHLQDPFPCAVASAPISSHEHGALDRSSMQFRRHPSL